MAVLDYNYVSVFNVQLVSYLCLPISFLAVFAIFEFISYSLIVNDAE